MFVFYLRVRVFICLCFTFCRVADFSYTSFVYSLTSVFLSSPSQSGLAHARYQTAVNKRGRCHYGLAAAEGGRTHHPRGVQDRQSGPALRRADGPSNCYYGLRLYSFPRIIARRSNSLQNPWPKPTPPAPFDGNGPRTRRWDRLTFGKGDRLTFCADILS